MSPLTATASCLRSGFHANPSGCGSFELTRFGAETVGIGWADAVAVGGALTPALGVATGSALLIGSITGPWSGIATAAIVPSAVIAIGPSSGPRFSGNGLSTPASALSQYHAPVPKARTASRPEFPGTAPSVKNAACVGGLARVVDLPGAGSSTPIPWSAA